MAGESTVADTGAKGEVAPFPVARHTRKLAAVFLGYQRQACDRDVPHAGAFRMQAFRYLQPTAHNRLRVEEMMRAAQRAIAYASEEIAIDGALHMLGLSAGALGSLVLIWMAGQRDCKWWPNVVYSACLLAMLSCSATYNLSGNTFRRPMLRRLDHAAIFLMIAGTYTPFTTRMSPESFGVSMTVSVWGFALLGALLKLLCPHRLERVDLALYLGLGWVILVGWEPLRATVDDTTVSLILAGGILYTIGAGFHVARRLRFHNAIWHGFVLAAASCHYAAVLRSLSAS